MQGSREHQVLLAFCWRSAGVLVRFWRSGVLVLAFCPPGVLPWRSGGGWRSGSGVLVPWRSGSGVLGCLAFWVWRSGLPGVLLGVLPWRSGGWRSAWRSGVLAFSISGVLAFWRSGWRSGVLVGVLAFCLAFCSASGGSPAMLLLAPFRGFSFQTPFWIYLLFPSGGSVFKSLFGFL